ncbi:MAG: hypothetical protein AAGI45_23820 [Cyanobacteria bacterium P01_H01_bin.26]
MTSYPSNLKELDVQRRQLERLWQPTPSEKVRQATSNWLRTAGQWLVSALAEGNQLRIWTQETKQGNVWCVYDPTDNVRHQFDSEAAVRTWLEQRYNR